MTIGRREWVVAATLLVSACGRPEPASAPPPSLVPAAPLYTMRPLPDSGFGIEWGLPGVPASVPAGGRFAAAVLVINRSDQVWPDAAHSDSTNPGAGAVRLGYRWWKASASKALVPYADARGDLVASVPPGSSAVVAVEVVAPSEPGSYELQLDMVQELVAWFEAKGSPRLTVPVKVVPQASR